MTGIWGTAQEVWDALVVPLVVPLSPWPRCPAVPLPPDCFTPEPTPLLPQGHSWALEQPGGLPQQRDCPEPPGQKGVSDTSTAQPGVPQRTNQTAGAKPLLISANQPLRTQTF